jgi:hypothetical protein
MEGSFKFFGKPEGMRPLGRRVDWRIILKWISYIGFELWILFM